VPVAEKHDADIKSDILILFFTPSQRKEKRKSVKRKKKRKIPKKEIFHAHIQSIYLIQALVSSVQV